MAPHSHSLRRQGVSLVEALVALAVMAFGMLALVGVQATMRLNSDVAKQRGEATRIATREIEVLRAFATKATYDGIAGLTTTQAPVDGVGNTTYTIRRLVVPEPSEGVPPPLQKSIYVSVSWTDRSDTEQKVVLETVISGTDPALAGLLAVIPTASAANQRTGRHASIPPVAVDLGDGRSAFKPFDTGTVAWLFNNLTGMITSRCTSVNTAQASITLASLNECGTPFDGWLLAGEVSFNFRFMPTDLTIGGEAKAILKPAAGASMAWVLDRDDRAIIDTCQVPAATAVASLTEASLTGCTAVNPQRPVSPYQLQCDPTPCTDTGGLVASDAVDPRWPALNLDLALVGTASDYVNVEQFNQPQAPECVDDAPTTAAAALARTGNSVRYFCLVVTSANGWGGRFDLQPLGFTDAGNSAWTIAAGGFKVCRYTKAATDYTTNSDHPATYCMEKSGTPTLETPCTGQRVKGNLINQNFLVIAASQSCPASTLLHQYQP